METKTRTAAARAARALVFAENRMHMGAMSSSARLAASDARALYARGDYEAAFVRARTSLTYSVGIFHPDYQTVSE